MESMVKEAALRYNWISPKEYLEAERQAEDKHEYFEGEVVTMQGASLRHEDIVMNVTGEIRNKLKGKDCRVRASNLRAATPFDKSFMYPDATIVCGEPQLADANFDILLNPTVIFEVVSKSTADYDYGRKSMHYRQIPALQQFIFINSYARYRVDTYTRNDENAWVVKSFFELTDIVELAAVGISIALADIYEHIKFEPQEAADEWI